MPQPLPLGSSREAPRGGAQTNTRQTRTGTACSSCDQRADSSSLEKLLFLDAPSFLRPRIRRSSAMSRLICKTRRGRTSERWTSACKAEAKQPAGRIKRRRRSSSTTSSLSARYCSAAGSRPAMPPDSSHYQPTCDVWDGTRATVLTAPHTRAHVRSSCTSCAMMPRPPSPARATASGWVRGGEGEGGGDGRLGPAPQRGE